MAKGGFDLGDFANSLNPAVTSAPIEMGPRTIETVTAEILDLKKTAGDAILAIGARLMEAKAMLPHGEWLPWLEERVEFSERTAQNFMRLSREWSNPQTLADLGAAKALTLLALPEEQRAEFIGQTHEVGGREKTVEEMSARELAQAIRERDEARKEAEAARAEAQTAETVRAKMAEDMAVVNASLEAARLEAENARGDLAQADDAVRDLQAQLEELRSRPIEVAVAEDTGAIEAARQAAIREMTEKVDRAKEAKTKADEKRKAAEEALAEANRKLEAFARSEKREAMAGDKDLATFEVLFVQAQEQANRLHGLLLKARSREDQSMAEKLRKAMLALANAIREAAE